MHHQQATMKRITFQTHHRRYSATEISCVCRSHKGFTHAPSTNPTSRDGHCLHCQSQFQTTSVRKKQKRSYEDMLNSTSCNSIKAKPESAPEGQPSFAQHKRPSPTQGEAPPKTAKRTPHRQTLLHRISSPQMDCDDTKTSTVADVGWPEIQRNTAHDLDEIVSHDSQYRRSEHIPNATINKKK